ncbi:MAG: PAS domain-containing protein [Glaciimonas sp.]|nr:PAS domain-containing protein [Glaciimonas sp.]
MLSTLPIDFEKIFQDAPVGMCVSQNRVIQVCNEYLSTMFTCLSEDLIGQSFQVLYPSAGEFEHTGERIVTIMNALGYYSDERIMKRANNELFWCRVTGRGLLRGDPHAAGIWTFVDLSPTRLLSAKFTPREREISALLVEGKTSKLIARQLDLSPRTVEMHRSKLMRKLNAANSSELVQKLLDVPRAQD